MAAERAAPGAPDDAGLGQRRLGCLASQDQLDQLGGDLLYYRTLSRDDFRSPTRPKTELLVRAVQGEEMGAAVAVSIVCVGETEITRLETGEFQARPANLRFYSVFDRERSWWNPRTTMKPEWILRHEQLHLDLAEISARALNASRTEMAEDTQGVGSSPEDALSALASNWELRMKQAIDALVDLESRYDRETGHGLELGRQTEWYERIQRDLARTRPHAAN
jgi:hypothetical protein